VQAELLYRLGLAHVIQLEKEIDALWSAGPPAPRPRRLARRKGRTPASSKAKELLVLDLALHCLLIDQPGPSLLSFLSLFSLGEELPLLVPLSS